MAECMTFPSTWEQFLHDYEFEDSRRIYTNGSRLIPSFRVKQMMEHFMPVVHGEWLAEDNIFDDSTWICSVCHEPWVLIDGTPKDNNMNYCPNCGALMKEAEHES